MKKILNEQMKKERRNKYLKEYYSRPEVKERKKEWWKLYSQKSEVKERKNELRKTPEGRKKIKEYSKIYMKRPEVIERNKNYYPKRKEYFKKYYSKPEVKQRVKDLLERPEFKEKVKAKRKIYYEANKDKWKYDKGYIKNKMLIDKEFAIRLRLRSRVNRAIKYYLENHKYSISKDEFLDYKAIIEYLKPFPEDITLYHIDHIQPLCSFDLTQPEEIKKAFAPENHQWLTIQENLSKGGRIT